MMRRIFSLSLALLMVISTLPMPAMATEGEVPEGEVTEHSWIDATCTAPKTCTVCGATEGSAMGHSGGTATCTAQAVCAICGEAYGELANHDEVNHDSKAPTCTEIGWETYVTCSQCDYTTYAEISATGHNWADATCMASKTCSVCGATEGEVGDHSWVDATCAVPKTCSLCGATEGDVGDHSWVDATCTAPKTCSVCGTTEGEALGHSGGIATCAAKAVCDKCGEPYGETLSHDEVSHEAKAPTCTEIGWNAYVTCSWCDYTTYAELSATHSWVDATCKVPQTCSACGATEGEPGTHSWIDATCTTPKTCSVCQETDGQALGHALVDGKCTACGVCAHGVEGTCSFCDLEKLIEEIPTFEELGQLGETDQEAYNAAIIQIQTAQDTYFALSKEDQKKVSNAKVLLDLLANYGIAPEAEESGVIVSLYDSEKTVYTTGDKVYIQVKVIAENGVDITYNYSKYFYEIIDKKTNLRIGEIWEDDSFTDFTLIEAGSYTIRCTAAYPESGMTSDSPVFEIKEPEIKFLDFENKTFFFGETANFTVEVTNNDGADYGYQNLVFEVLNSDTGVRVGDPWEDSIYASFSPSETGTYIICCTATYSWGTITAESPTFEVTKPKISFPDIEQVEFIAGDMAFFELMLEGGFVSPSKVTLVVINDTDKQPVGDSWEAGYGSVSHTFDAAGSYFLSATATYSWGTVTQDSPVFEVKEPNVTISFPNFENVAFAKGDSTGFEIEITNSSYQRFDKIKYELFRADTNASTGIAWESNNDWRGECTPEESGQYYIKVTVCYPWGEKTQNTPVFTVHEGIYPTEVAFADSEATIGQNVTIWVDTVGTGRIESVVYKVTDENGEVVLNQSIVSTDCNFQPMKAGTYICEITLTDTAGNVYTKTTEDSLVVGSYLYLNQAYVSDTKFALGESVTITAETLGQGSGATFEYSIRDPRKYEIVETVTSKEATLVYTPQKAGEFYCEVTMTNDDDGKVSSAVTEDFTVNAGLWVEQIVTESAYENNASVTIMAFTSGEGTIQNVQFQVYSNDDVLVDSHSGTDLTYVFRPEENNKDSSFYVKVTLTDKAGNVSSLVRGFSVYAGGRDYELETDKETYNLGDTITFTLTTEEGSAPNKIRYEIRDYILGTIVKVVDDTTELSCTFTPDYGSKYQCSVKQYDGNGNISYSITSSAILVEDTRFAFNAVNVSSNKPKPGDEITFTCDVSDKTQVQSVHCFYRDHMGRVVDVYKGTDTTWKYTPETYMDCNFVINIIAKNGSAYQKHVEIHTTDENECTVESAKISADRVRVGTPVTVTLTLGGSKEYKAIEYRVYRNKDGFEEVFTSQGTTFTYIPDEASEYHISVYITQKDGTTQNQGRGWAEFYATNSIYLVETKHQTNMLLGEQYQYVPKTGGEGSFVYIRYELEKNGKQVDLYEGTEMTYKFTPTEVGNYVFQVTAVNDEGLTFTYFDNWTVYADLFLSEIQVSNTVISLGNTLDIKPVFRGDGTVKWMYCGIRKQLSDSETSSAFEKENTGETIKWTPAEIGTYYVSLEVCNNKDNYSGTYVIVKVVDDLVNLPTEKPSGSSMDLTKAESSTMEAEASAWAEEGQQVSISMDVNYVAPNSSNPSHQKIEKEAGDKELELLDITIEKEVDGEKSTISETKVVQEIKIPYNFSRKANLSVYRVHDGEVQAFRRLTAKPSSPTDGTFYADIAFGYLYIYSSRFSVFGVAYDPGVNITYMDGTTALKTDVFAQGEGLASLWTPAKSGYTFVGWYDASGKKVTSIAKDVTTDVVLYAKWQKVVVSDSSSSGSSSGSSGTPSDNPATGDMILVPVCVMVFSGVALLVLLIDRKKKYT